MPGVEDFVVDLARTGKSCKEIKQTVNSVYLDKSMTRKQIYNILKHVKYGKNTDDQRHFNAKKTKQTLSLVDTDVIDNQCCGSKYIEFGSGSRSRILAPDPGFWPNLNPDPDPGADPNPGLYYQL